MTNIFPRKEFEELTDNSNPIEFQIIDWYIPETDKKERDENEKYHINVYGTDSNNITYNLRVDEYEPYFYVKPPSDWNGLTDKEFSKKKDELNITLLEEKYESSFRDPDTKRITKYNKRIIGDKYLSHFNGLSIEKKKDFWGFTNNKIFRFIKVSTKSLYLYNQLKYYFNSILSQGFKLYESNIDPFLKFIHIQDIKPCGWIRLDNYELNDNAESRCNCNITAKWSDVKSINVNKIAPLLILSFDIECSSSHGDFPVAKKNYKKLAQDLCMISKVGFEYNNEYIKSWILNAYMNDVELDENYRVHRLYAKGKLNISKIEEKLNNIVDEIRFVLDKISSIADDDEEGDEPSNMTIKELNEYEDKLNRLLTKALPELEGDKVIQIGNTVHKYGSDEIIYRNIITLDTCDDIQGVDVISCKTEDEMLMQWKKFLMKLDPDIITGYNIFGFDFEYIWLRVVECGIRDNFSVGIGRSLTRKVSLIEQKLSSSALGDNILKYLDLDGVVIIDLFKVIQRDQKLDSYKLDNVASIFIGEQKDDLKPNEIFKKFKGNSEDRAVIAKYCIQDCALCNKLMHKLKILENNIGMGNVCLVPLNYLFKRGQGIKIFSLINNECMKKGFLIPVIKGYNSEEVDDEGYEGAIVLEPKTGIYLNDPIVVFDYGSLYPSSMICRNLSHDTYVNDPKYLIEDENIEYAKVSYDLYEGTGDKKVKTGVKECIFAQYKDGRKGIIPEILNMLLDERKNTRKKIEYKTIIDNNNNEFFGFPDENDEEFKLFNIDTKETKIILKNNIKEIKDTYNKFEKDVFDSLQSAYKVTANSLYGQIGARTSPIYLKEIAACTTSTGREMIMIAKEFVEKNYNAEVIYGDSVMPYTPITYKMNDIINITTFEKLHGEWFEYNNFKPNDIDRFEKEQFIPLNMKVWTHKGWSNVRRVIRHKTIKKIYRVLTHTGLVDVTEDHSLLDTNGQIIKPSECEIGKELLHSKPDINYCNDISKDKAYVDCLKITANDQLTAQKYYVELQSLGYNISIRLNNNKYVLTYSNLKLRKNEIAIKSINVLYEKYDGYVYDIETEEGVFHAGIGNMILKNTDSIFCKFPIKDEQGNDINGKDALQAAINVGKNVESNIVKILPKPQKLNYEKVLYPLILVSKKRYVANLYEHDVNKFKQKSMGIVLKRRDNAQIVKTIYGGIINIILNKQDLRESIHFLREELKDLVNGNVDIKELILSKTLNSSYKDPTKIAHRVLADRIGARDPGNKPAINDRIQYIYIKVPNAKLQGDKIETPEFIKENKLTPDYLHYITNQIMKPVLQLYELCLEDLPNYEEDHEYWDNIEKELMKKPLYLDQTKRKHRLENLRLNMVQDLLFNEFIQLLTEPKIKKERKTKEVKIKEIKDEVKEEKKSKKVKEEVKEEEKKDDKKEVIGSIKIVQDRTTKNMKLDCNIIDPSNKKVIWVYANENSKGTRDDIIKKTIIQMIEKSDGSYIKIKISHKKFIKDYQLIIAKYNNIVKEYGVDNDHVFTAINNNDVGKLKEITEISNFKDLIQKNDKFELV